MRSREIGDRGEDVAAQHIKSIGCEIICRNYVIRGGELDIIFRDGECLVFCEVKTRGSRSFGTPAEAVTVKKQRRLSKTALSYMYTHGICDMPARFDVIEVFGDNGRVNHIKNAFEYVE